MKIEIDDLVFAELERRALGFNVTPNDVLRSVLGLKTTPFGSNGASKPTDEELTAGTLTEFLTSDRFRRYHQAIDRFLAILAWVYLRDAKRFADVVPCLQRGRRTYFAKGQQEIEQSGCGINAKRIPQTPYWALTTLDNKAKRTIIEDLLHALGYSRHDIELAIAQLPDSEIRRRQRSLIEYTDL